MREIGAHYEAQAAHFLQQSGLEILQKNFTCRAGEIDLICRDLEYLVFVEVRYRQNAEYGGAAASVTYVKRTRIIRSAKRFLQTNTSYRDWPSRFDVVAVSGATHDLDVQWMPSAFDC